MKIFWSWQSDISGNISRHFVKECITKATDVLNESVILDERFEIDHDTKGIPGSPPIAETIFKKIDESGVFIADVTPVASIKVGVRNKKIMNPNVAIETGYAISSRGHTRIMTVMNTAFGSIEDLPFDLKYKRGPITYHLPDGSTKEYLLKEQNKLVNSLKEAFILHSKINTEKKEDHINLDLNGPAIFYEQDEPIIRLSPGMGGVRDEVSYVKKTKSYFYVKVIPEEYTHFLKKELAQLAFHNGKFKIFPLFKNPDQTPQINKYGCVIVCFEGVGKEGKVVPAFTQIFKNGTIIGISTFSSQGNRIPLITLRKYLDQFINEAVSLLKASNRFSATTRIRIEIGLANGDNSTVILPDPIGKHYFENTRGPLEELNYNSNSLISLDNLDDLDQVTKKFILVLLDDLGIDFDFDSHQWS